MNENVNTPNEENFIGQDKISFLPKEKRYIMVTDEETGKIKGCYPLKKKNLGSGWVAVYQAMLITIAQLNLPNEVYRVFLTLLGKVDFENYLTVIQQDIANELNMQRSNVARAIKKLKELNIIVEGPRAGLNKTYRLNPYVAHKGTNRKNTIVDFESALNDKGKNIFDADISDD